MVTIFTGKAQDAEESIKALKAQLDQAAAENVALASRLERARAESAIKEVKEKRGSVTQLENGGGEEGSGGLGSSLTDRLNFASLEGKLDEQRAVLESILAATTATAPKGEGVAAVVDLSGLEAKLDKLVEVVGEQREGGAPAVDLSGLEAKLDKLAVPKSEGGDLDLKVELSGLEAKLDKLAALVSSPPAPSDPDSDAEKLTSSLPSSEAALAAAAELEQLRLIVSEKVSQLERSEATSREA